MENNKPKNPNAFPNTDPDYFGASDGYGMELRDYFAAKAMQGLIVGVNDVGSKQIERLSNISYNIADAMLKEREIKTDE